MYYTVYARNNWSSDWTAVEHADVQWSGSEEQLSDEASFSVRVTVGRLSETDTANLFRMYSEIRIDETDHNDDTFTRFHGFIIKTTPSVDSMQLSLVDFWGLCQRMRCDVPPSSAAIIRKGTDAAPVAMIMITEDGEDRYIPDDATYPELFTGGVPDVDKANRRTWKAFAGVRDDGTQDTDPEDPNYYPDHLIPPGMWTIGSDLLNYLQFVGYTPIGNITVDFIIVYVEGTNELEDVVLNALSVALPHGPGLVAGTHYNATSSDYFVRTIWPSLITVNEWVWYEHDGTVADMIEKLLSSHAPPNYKLDWDHSLMMARLQYREIMPFDVNTSYYLAGSYPYGRIVTAPPDPETSDDYIDYSEISQERTIERDTEIFKSKIVVYGVNEWPDNAVTEDMVTTLEAYWPAGWTLDPLGSIAGMLDKDFGTFSRIWYDNNNSPPTDESDKYYPTYHIAFDDEQTIERLRFWMLDSRRDFPFGIRVEAHNDPGFPTYDPDAPWEPMHADLWNRMAKPFELVDVSGNFMRSVCRCILISMRPGKIHLRFRWAGGLSEMEVTRSSTVSGKAYVVRADPGAGWDLIRGAGATGSWYQKVGVKEKDGEIAVLLPNLYDQLNSRSAIANKLVAGHVADIKENRSLANTNQCAFEAARILAETLRDCRKFNFTGKSYQNVQKYRTALITDPFFGVTRKALIQSLASNQPGTVDIASSAYGYSDASRGGTWTNEEPDAL